ncbi:MAG: tRNA epoxyqueuosine(34) reductase QueG [Bacteroidales bacterium]
MSASFERYSSIIKAKAFDLGFDKCGIVKAQNLYQYSDSLDHWLNRGYNAEMEYMNRNNEKRKDIRKMVDGVKSLVLVLMNYNSNNNTEASKCRVAKYALGKDYHFVIKEKLAKLKEFIDENIAQTRGRAFTDSAPVMERSYAVLANFGWIGKNSMLINKELGSFTFIGELALNIELKYEETTYKDRCGSCTRCIDACPTQAIVPNERMVNSEKCISYQNIEKKGTMLPEIAKLSQSYVFGCDICQNVCPWNNKAPLHNTPEFEPIDEIFNLDVIAKEEFNKVFKSSPLQRKGWEEIMRNISAISR